jgi:2-haloacid dehalogenase
MPALRLSGIRACVFDAYGTLFDVTSAAVRAKDALGERWQPLSELWRAKQLQYTWLRSLMGRHVDFWQVTGDALDYAMASLAFQDVSLRGRLMRLYLELDAYPEVKETLSRLKAAGLRLAILSNGAPKMLAAAVKNSGIFVQRVGRARRKGVRLSRPEVQPLRPGARAHSGEARR